MTFLRVAVLAASLLAPLPLAYAESPAPAHSPSLEDQLAPLTTDRLFRDAKVSVQVVDVRTGEEVFARNADRPLNPASTMKVLTTAAALHTLGPSYRFTTALYVDGEIDDSGVVQGDLYVKGHGDPTLVVERLWKLVYDLKLEGVERVSGDVVYDESFFATDYALPGWDKKEDLERGPAYFPALSALSLNFNTVALVVGPGSEVGAPGTVRLETPADSYVTVVNEVVTGSASSWRSLEIEREVTGPTMQFTVAGAMPLGGGTRKFYRSVAEPTSHFAAAFQQMMEAHEIQVGGRHRRGQVPESASLVHSLRSPPLAAILMDMNKYSNNFMAEQVLRAMGAEVHGVPGTTAKGLQVIGDYLVSIGVEGNAFTLINGSGLSRDAWVAPSTLTAVMVDMAHDPRAGHEFVSSLAIAGQDGTLYSRLAEEPGRTRGKTGTIDGIHCLTAYVEGGDGVLYAFAFLVNDVRGSLGKVKRLQDRLVGVLYELDVEASEVVDPGEVNDP
ncbi:MAG: D-alanyl-D-alanine carboxypeptidase/D-alanyl-D-alanine-endopeptidase [Deltaproteobacteria bacterium]|nr:D-alanyl-D-alanine carboxypeptidase/D-alanyl-D-alanine-endopeptidase [Deltaproteobacteria bacterium]